MITDEELGELKGMVYALLAIPSLPTQETKQMKDYELLEAQARMMRMAEKYGVDDWKKLVEFKLDDKWVSAVGNAASLYSSWMYRFALGVVEGKPVFEGDTLWHRNREFTADEHLSDYIMDMKNPSELSWNPPKPKTVTISIPFDTAERYANNDSTEQDYRLLVNLCKAEISE